MQICIPMQNDQHLQAEQFHLLPSRNFQLMFSSPWKILQDSQPNSLRATPFTAQPALHLLAQALLFLSRQDVLLVFLFLPAFEDKFPRTSEVL